MSKKKGGLVRREKSLIDEAALFDHVAQIIESRKSRAGAYANREVTLMYWEVGRHVGSILLGGERAEYGKKILATLSQRLMKKYGSSFEYTKMTRMMRSDTLEGSKCPRIHFN